MNELQSELENGSPVAASPRNQGSLRSLLRGARFPLQSVLVAKALTALIVFFSVELLPIFNVAQFRSVPHQLPAGGDPTWISHLTSWNAANYVYLAEHGYVDNSLLSAFYPAWPMILKCAHLLGLDTAVFGLIAANLLSMFGFTVFYGLVKKRFGEEVSAVAVILMLATPGAFFFSFIYTEPLFFALTMILFWGMEHRQYGLVAASGLLLPSTRAVGIFGVLPLVVDSWRHRRIVATWVSCAAFLAGLGLYFLFMQATTGNWLEGFEAQKHYANQPSIGNILHPERALKALFSVNRLHGYTDSAIDRALFLLLLVYLPAIWRADRRYFVYALGIGVVPALSNLFLSYSRFVILCFPLYVVMAQQMSDAKRRPLFFYTIAVAGILQAMLLIRHINYYWAG
jgi:hypothetical protein